MSTPTRTLAVQLQQASKLPLVKLAPLVGVSRQTYHKWLRGLPMKPEHQKTIEQMLQELPVGEQSPAEQPTYTVSYTIKSIAFECYRCGASLTLNRRNLGSIAGGIFCYGCHEHYWIAWETGELHHGTPNAAMAELRGAQP